MPVREKRKASTGRSTIPVSRRTWLITPFTPRKGIHPIVRMSALVQNGTTSRRNTASWSPGCRTWTTRKYAIE